MTEFSQTQVMGILNVTPDSFSDGARYQNHEMAIQQALRMQDQGAAWIDIGGESSRPGAVPVSASEELDRVLPVIEGLASVLNIPISIDTSKPEVMRAAIKAGAAMINDIYALRQDGALATAAQLRVPVCLMHMQGEPKTMQEAPVYPGGVVNDVRQFLVQRAEAATAAGILPSNILIDPGFGFGKTLTQNYELLRGLPALSELGYRILVGLSRKSMIGNLLQVDVASRLPGSLAAAVIAAIQGAAILRVHDVAETVQALEVTKACFLPEH